jgi:excisionase family DNA binding protein
VKGLHSLDALEFSGESDLQKRLQLRRSWDRGRMSSKVIKERRDHSERRRGLSGQLAKKRAAAEGSDQADLARLIRIIARQAAQEAFSVFLDALDGSAIKAPPLQDLPKLEHAQEGDPGKERVSPQRGERFLSVAEVSKKLGVSEKTVRRKIASGDWPAHRVGKLVRVSERVLTAHVIRGSSKRG